MTNSSGCVSYGPAHPKSDPRAYLGTLRVSGCTSVAGAILQIRLYATKPRSPSVCDPAHRGNRARIAPTPKKSSTPSAATLTNQPSSLLPGRERRADPRCTWGSASTASRTAAARPLAPRRDQIERSPREKNARPLTTVRRVEIRLRPKGASACCRLRQARRAERYECRLRSHGSLYVTDTLPVFASRLQPSQGQPGSPEPLEEQERDQQRDDRYQRSDENKRLDDVGMGRLALPRAEADRDRVHILVRQHHQGKQVVVPDLDERGQERSDKTREHEPRSDREEDLGLAGAIEPGCLEQLSWYRCLGRHPAQEQAERTCAHDAGKEDRPV